MSCQSFLAGHVRVQVKEGAFFLIKGHGKSQRYWRSRCCLQNILPPFILVVTRKRPFMYIKKMQMVGEASRCRQVVKVLNNEGKVVYVKPRYPMVWLYSLSYIVFEVPRIVWLYHIELFYVFHYQVKVSDTSAGESGSEAEDIASPKAARTYSHLQLTPVREEVVFYHCFY